MFGKKDGALSGTIDTIIGANVTINGNLESEGSIHIHGKVKGDINVKGNLILGEASSVLGNIQADTIEVSGIIQGNVTAASLLKLNSTAKLFGDIQVNSFVTDEGAIFQGQCKMKEIAASAQSNELLEVTDKLSRKPKGRNEFKKSALIDASFDEKNGTDN